jgi:hypothetical protein
MIEVVICMVNGMCHKLYFLENIPTHIMEWATISFSYMQHLEKHNLFISSLSI